MNTIQVVNVKCGWCAKTITKQLEKIGASNISIGFNQEDNSQGRTISFEGDVRKVEEKLNQLGYPKVGTPEADKLLKKAKSFVSCALWKM